MQNPHDDNMQDEKRPTALTIEESFERLEALEDGQVIPVGIVYGFSNLHREQLDKFKAKWGTLPTERRRQVATYLAEIGESNFDLAYEAIAYILLEDSDAVVRTKAIDLTWYVSSKQLFHIFMDMAKNDSSATVQAAVMGALGRFIYEGELEEFDETLAKQAQELALEFYEDRTLELEIRRRSLEAIANSSHPRVHELITEAYDDPEPMMQVSAVFAMGASHDKRWNEAVFSELDNPDPQIRFEAVRSAGHLGLERAVRDLVTIGYEEDVEIQLMVVWALGQIATNEARRGLHELAELADEQDDDVLSEAIEEALELASLFSGFMSPMFDFDEDIGDIDDPSRWN